jgi:superfamily II DNA or RNA helicase
MDFSNFSDNRVKAAYSKLYDIAIVANVERNKLAAKITSEIINSNTGPILVLVTKVGTSKKKNKDGTETTSISHAEIFQELLEDLYGITLPIIHGGTKSKVRAKVLEDLGNKLIPGAIASTGILSEGISIPSLQYVNNLAAGSSSKDFLQRAGRALRIQEGKDQPKYIDYLDTSHSVFANQSRKRKEAAEENYPGSVVIIQH